MPTAAAPSDRLTAALARSGLNVVGVADPARWDAEAPPARRSGVLLPGCRAIVVVGSGGTTLWDRFLAALEARPAALTDEAHPLDEFVRAAVRAADPELGDAARRWFFADSAETVPVDLRLLASHAGLGTRSRLGLLLHPVYGPWLGLRAACFVDLPLPPAAPLHGSACDACPAPCARACPGAAFPAGALDIDRCATWNRTTEDCRAACHARAACPEGAAHRYSPEEQAYHTHRPSGRRWLRARVGVPDGADRFEGEGPFWGDWRDRVDVTGARPKAG